LSKKLRASEEENEKMQAELENNRHIIEAIIKKLKTQHHIALE